MTATMERRIDRWQIRLGVLGIAALISVFIGGWFHSQRFFISYLFAYLFWFGFAIGCAIITMIHHLTGGQWGHSVRRILEAGLATFPLLALLFVPIVFGLKALYPWATKSFHPEIQNKLAYLNSGFFIGRAVFYFVVWSFFALKIRGLSLDQDETRDPAPTRRILKHSGLGVVIFPLLATFAYVDWIMSIEPRWHSTIFALVILAGQMLVGNAFAVMALSLLQKDGCLEKLATKARCHQLGNLLLTFVLFWTYLAFSQLLIIYSANNPEEIDWYLHRIHGPWKLVIGAVALFQFFLPFLLLLFRASKRSGTVLGALAAWLLVIQLIYTYWLIVPTFAPSAPQVSWMDFVTPVGIGAIWLGSFLWLLKRAPLVPLNDPRMREEMAHAE